MDFRNLNTFIKIADLNSFSKAAMELGYTQSTVTMQIKALEEELQVSLFDRIGKTIRLTEKGSVLLTYAKEIQFQTEQIKQQLLNSNDLCGELRIGAFESICYTLLPPVLKQFHEQYPAVSLTIKTGSFTELRRLLNSNQIDLLWIFDHPIQVPNWCCALSTPYPLLILSNPFTPFVSKKSLKLEELSNAPFLLSEQGCQYRRELEQVFSRYHLPFSPVMEIDNIEIIRQFIKSGLGLGFLPAFLVQDDLLEGSLLPIQVKNTSFSMYSQLLYHKEKWITPTIKAFLSIAPSIVTKFPSPFQ